MKEISRIAKKLKKHNELLKKVKDLIVVNITVSRNEKCPCGSGFKFKKCCINKK